MKLIDIPRRIDEPPHLMLWSADELAPMLLGLVVGVVVGKALLCVLAGMLVTNLYRRFKDSNPDGYLLHMLYWTGAAFSKGRSMVNPFIRTFVA